ncbi:MAG: DUF4395 domain-containing protein [Sphingobacteriales bacterium JAD_PAG50586_3]|nr:MAG: DUF4395 domain-containing protein [Sphingobacteriales bacterium JAD_PAG50586_3]
MSEVTCPISDERVDENTTRVVAAITIIITLPALYFNAYPVFILLGLDFAIRAFTKGDYSVLRNAGKALSTALNLPKKPIDAAPKKFAAGVGLAFSITIAILQLAGLTNTALLLGAVLLVCAFLEAALAYCVGCVVYSYLVLPVIGKFK